MVRKLLLALLLTVLLIAPAVSAPAPDPDTHYGADINDTFGDPTDLSVVVVPAGYFSSTANLGDTGWVGPDALVEQPGTQAVLEAIAYWDWILEQYEPTWPQLDRIDWTTKVLGHDATVEDLRTADVVVTTAMVNDPAPFIFHLGLGKNTLPAESLLFNTGPMSHCTVWNTGAGSRRGDVDPLRLRNLAIHEFGHCLAAGHSDWCHGGRCYDPPPGDVMDDVHGRHRECISNLNVKSVALGYHWLSDGDTWKPHHDAVFVEKTSYERLCMPESMTRV